MKRSSPLKRSTKPLKRSWLQKRSKDRREEYKKYYALLDTLFKKHPYCQICGIRPSDNPHHIDGRKGKKLYDPDNVLATCGICHPQRIHFGANIPLDPDDHHYEEATKAGLTHYGPKWARHFGYLK